MLLRQFLIGIAFFTGALAQESSENSALLNTLESRLSYLEETVAQLRGNLEEVERKLKTLPQNPVSAPMTPMDSAAKGPVPTLPELGQSSPTSSSKEDSQQLYDTARAFLNKQAFREAEITFKDLIATYPTSPLVINAKYWLGEIYLSRADYDKAATNFAEAYALNKTNKKDMPADIPSKAQEALLKLAFALRGQGKNEEVCAILDQLKNEFAAFYNTKKTAVERAKKGLSCEK